MGVGDVAGGEHARRRWSEVLVDEDAVLDASPPAAASSVRGAAPTPTTTTSQSTVAVAACHALDGVVALEALPRRVPSSISTPWSAWRSR